MFQATLKLHFFFPPGTYTFTVLFKKKKKVVLGSGSGLLQFYSILHSQLLQSILLFFVNNFKEQTQALLFTHRSSKTFCAKQDWRTNKGYGSQFSKI